MPPEYTLKLCKNFVMLNNLLGHTYEFVYGSYTETEMFEFKQISLK